MDDRRGGDQQTRIGPSAGLSWSRVQDCVREISPPRPVLVSSRAIDYGPSGMLYADHPPELRVRASGLRVELETEGWQSAWVRLSAGEWRAVVTLDLFSANRSTALSHLTILVRPEDLRLPG